MPTAFAVATTTVSGTLTDRSGTRWFNAIVQARLQPWINTGPQYTVDGVPVNPEPPFVITDAGGTFSIDLPSNMDIAPAGSSWQFIIIPETERPPVVLDAVYVGHAAMDISALFTETVTEIEVQSFPIPRAQGNIEVAPAPRDGQLYFDTSMQTLKYSSNGAWVAIGSGGGGGGTLPHTTNLIAGDGSGNGADSGIPPGDVAQLSAANNIFANQVNMPSAYVSSGTAGRVSVGDIYNYIENPGGSRTIIGINNSFSVVPYGNAWNSYLFLIMWQPATNYTAAFNVPITFQQAVTLATGTFFYFGASQTNRFYISSGTGVPVQLLVDTGFQVQNSANGNNIAYFAPTTSTFFTDTWIGNTGSGAASPTLYFSDPYDWIRNPGGYTLQINGSNAITVSVFNASHLRFVYNDADYFDFPVILVRDPQRAMEAATKQYVDAHSGGGTIPAAGVAVSDGTTWTTPIDPADLPRLSALSNTFNINGYSSFGTMIARGSVPIAAAGPNQSYIDNYASNGRMFSTGPNTTTAGGFQLIGVASDLTTNGIYYLNCQPSGITAGRAITAPYLKANDTFNVSDNQPNTSYLCRQYQNLSTGQFLSTGPNTSTNGGFTIVGATSDFGISITPVVYMNCQPSGITLGLPVIAPATIVTGTGPAITAGQSSQDIFNNNSRAIYKSTNPTVADEGFQFWLNNSDGSYNQLMGSFTHKGLYVNGQSDGSIPGLTTGTRISWNIPSGAGNTVFINYQGGGGGGFVFFNEVPDAVVDGTSVALLSIDGAGNAVFKGSITGTAKNFKVQHPLDDTKDLWHSCLEGPEHGVYYRGEGETYDGKAVIELPDYFESLTREWGRTVQLTVLIDDDNPVFGGQIGAGRVKNGRFIVYSTDPSTRFYWEVKAVRADIKQLEVVRSKE